MQNILKALGAALAIIALCAPLIFWPVDEAQTRELRTSATVTVPPTVAVAAPESPEEALTAAEAASTTTTTEPLQITIAVVGDVATNMPIVESALDPESGGYDFSPVLAPIAPYLQVADYTVAGLETRLAGSEAGYSGYPRFNSPDMLATDLKEAGVDLVATANEHSLDLGLEGVISTLDVLDEAGLAHVGTHRSSAESQEPFVVNINGIPVGFLNYTAEIEGLSVPEDQPWVVNTLDVEKVAYDAAMARSWGARVVIALLHYGGRLERQPSEEQTDISEELLKQGVDVILGAHPGVVQPISHVFEYSGSEFTDKYVAYSLGNFVSTQRWDYSDSGIVAYVHIEKRGLRAYVTGVSYLPVYMQKGPTSTGSGYRVLPVLPGLEPVTDIPLSDDQRVRMREVWEEMRIQLHSPNEGISYFKPANLPAREEPEQQDLAGAGAAAAGTAGPGVTDGEAVGTAPAGEEQ